MGFRKLWELARKKSSRLIVAVDDERALNGISSLLRKLEETAVGIKLGFPALFRLGPKGIKDITGSWGDLFYFLADYKLADIPYIVNLTLLKLRDVGFDGATIHMFQRGLDGALNGDIPEVIGVISMSHKSPLLDREFHVNLQYAKGLGMKGLVVGATKKEFIGEGKKEGFVIFSPGIGPQGGRVAEALKLGSDFEIVGRAIVKADDIREAARRIVEAERKVFLNPNHPPA